MSSPITQWQKEKINPILGELFSTGEMAETAGLTHDMRMDALRKATRLITSATIELIEGLIDAYEDRHELPRTNTDEDGMRQELRQSLKEMKS